MEIYPSTTKQAETQFGCLLNLNKKYNLAPDISSRSYALIENINVYLFDSSIELSKIDECPLTQADNLPKILKHQLCIYMLVLNCIEGQVNQEMFNEVKTFAHRNHIKDGNIHDIQRALANHQLILQLDFARRALLKVEDFKIYCGKFGKIHAIPELVKDYLRTLKIASFPDKKKSSQI